MGLKIFFSGDQDDDTYDPSALRSKSHWRAPLPPTEVDTRICRFQQELQTIFTRRHSPSNLSPTQQKILKQLRDNKDIVILSADKGLGPVGVNTKQYIAWGMKHITDETTYSIISSEQAHMEANELYNSIFQ